MGMYFTDFIEITNMKIIHVKCSRTVISRVGKKQSPSFSRRLITCNFSECLDRVSKDVKEVPWLEHVGGSADATRSWEILVSN